MTIEAAAFRAAALTVLVTIAAVPAACSVPPSARSGTGRATVYSPPTRVGGTGRVISLPAPLQPAVTGVREGSPSLERPDATPTTPTRAWLVGSWLLHASARDVDRDACDSDRPVAFGADGTLRFSQGRGRWSLQGRTLVQTITEGFESADPDLKGDIGRPQRTRIRRVGPDEGALLVDGVWLPILRCRVGNGR